MRIAIITALHKRYELTKLFLSYYAKTWDHPLFAVIDNDDLQMWHLMRHFPEWTTCEHANQPLANKWLACMKLAEKHKDSFDAVMIVGSDDFIDDTYKKHVESALYLAFRESVDRFGEKALPEMHIQPRYIYYMDALKGRMMRVRHKRPGAGRVLTKPLLERIKYIPWSEGDANIDGSMDKRLACVYGDHIPYAFIEDDIGTILDVKTGESLWDYDYLRKKDFDDLDAEAILSERFPLIASRLLTWK